MSIAITCNCGATFVADPGMANTLVACPVCNMRLSLAAGGVVSAARQHSRGGVLPDGDLQLRLDARDELAAIPEARVLEADDDGPDIYHMTALAPWQQRGPAATLQKFWAGIGVISLANPATCLALGPFNEWGLAGCGMDVQLLNMKSGSAARAFQKHEAPVSVLAILPDGRAALSGDAAGNLLLWELANGMVTQRVRAHMGAVTAIAVAPEAPLAVTGGADGATRLWDLSCGCHAFPIANPGALAEISSVAFSADGRFFLAGDHDGRVDIWTSESGNFERCFDAGAPIASVRSFDGYVTAVVSPQPSDIAVHPKVLRWDLQTGRAVGCFDRKIEPRLIPTCVSLDRDGRRLLVLGYPPGLAFQHVPTAFAGTLAQMRDGFRDFFRMRDGRPGISALEVWSLATGALLHAYPEVQGDLHCLAISPENTRLLAASVAGRLHIYAMPEA